MLSFIKCGGFVIESISQYESIFKSYFIEWRYKVVQKIQRFIGQNKQNNLPDC